MTNNIFRQWLIAGALLTVVSAFVAPPAAHAGEKITLRLAYTSDNNGYVDACG